MPSRTHARIAKQPPGFDVEQFLRSSGSGRRVVRHERGNASFLQGDPADDIRYLQTGNIRLSVLSPVGKEAVVAMLRPGDFFGEGSLVGQKTRLETATAQVASTVLIIEREAMARLLHEEPTFSDCFIAHMLDRNTRFEADLVDQLFNCSEKRLARALLLLADCNQRGAQRTTLPRISQQTLANMIGTSRPRVNFFINKFKKLGFIESDRCIKVNSSLLNVLLRD